MPGLRITVQGQVQGLGFRPFVYRLAKSLRLGGYVVNSTKGVEIVVQGRRVSRFLREITTNPPSLALISALACVKYRGPKLRDFKILPSVLGVDAGVFVLPDIATCQECRQEITDPENRRFGYPFTNCTQCGPRYTIIETLPYDRPNTTMRQFRMCAHCSQEYSDPVDRRFHAQPNACPACGPALRLLDSTGRKKPVEPVSAAARALAKGRIVAVRSLGGFHLACDATSDRAVARLRRRKLRPTKPLALMCEGISTVSGFCCVNPNSKGLLESDQAPIVLMPKKAGSVRVSGLVAPNNARYGVMLAYTPLHIALLARVKELSGRPPVLVMTSANPREEPITADDADLYSELPSVADFVLTHDRPIANRCDDSVVLADQPPVMLRRARGFAPQSIRLSRMFHVKQPVLAVGGEMRSSFALADKDRVFLGPYLGSVGSARGESFFRTTLARYLEWTGIKPGIVACDLHPDYYSTRIAEHLSQFWRLPLVRLQHHYAHAVSVLAEHGIGPPAIGLVFDGAGYGTDGNTWGCEFLLLGRRLEWTRVGHMRYLALPSAGAELADPTRVARAYLKQARERDRVTSGPTAVRTSSLGRLFDAVAGITGICRRATFEGEAAVALEAAAAPGEHKDYFSRELLEFSSARTLGDVNSTPATIDPAPLLLSAAGEVQAGVAPGSVAAKFQNSVVKAAVALASTLAHRHGTRKILLSGGSFQNSVLRNGIRSRLTDSGFRVWCNEQVPVNDGGVCLGQAVAAGQGMVGHPRVRQPAAAPGFPVN